MQKRSSIGAKYKSYYNEIFNRVGGKRSSWGCNLNCDKACS